MELNFINQSGKTEFCLNDKFFANWWFLTQMVHVHELAAKFGPKQIQNNISELSQLAKCVRIGYFKSPFLHHT